MVAPRARERPGGVASYRSLARGTDHRLSALPDRGVLTYPVQAGRGAAMSSVTSPRTRAR